MAAQSYSLLCMLGALVLVAEARRPLHAVAVLAGLLAGLLVCGLALPGWSWSPRLVLEADQGALLLVLLSLAWLRRRLPLRLALVGGGFFGAVWLQSLAGIGYPALLGLPLVLGSLVVAAVASIRLPGFRTPQLQQEAFVILLVAGLALAVIPGLADGWRTALGLQQQLTADAAAEAVDSSPWMFWVSALCVVVGVLRTQWKYRNH